MASYTQHYQLHQWEPSDQFLRTDFNEDFKKIDTAIYNSETGLRTNLSSEVSRLNTALSTAQQTLRSEFNSSIQKVNTTLASVQALAEGRANIVFGTYTGDGRSSTTVNLGFAAKWIVVFAAAGYTDNGYGGLAAVDYPIYSSTRGTHLEIVGNFIRIACDAVHGPVTNLSGQVYYYLAAR